MANKTKKKNTSMSSEKISEKVVPITDNVKSTCGRVELIGKLYIYVRLPNNELMRIQRPQGDIKVGDEIEF